MTIKKFLTGFLKSVNLKQSEPPTISFPEEFPHIIVCTIEDLQAKYPELILCGSAALMLTGALPYRPMHDIDFVLNRRNFKDSGVWLKTKSYSEVDNDGYTSYILYRGKNYPLIKQDINILVFDDAIELNSESVKSFGKRAIKMQRQQDILRWKEKYNREKDIKDLDAIASKALEDAIFKDF